MIMSAIGSFIILMFVNRNAAILVMMMVVVDTDLSDAMRRVVNGPSGCRDAHAKRQPDESEQTQQEYTAIHGKLVRRCQQNGQSGFLSLGCLTNTMNKRLQLRSLV